jgi:hypothetical protein
LPSSRAAFSRAAIVSELALSSSAKSLHNPSQRLQQTLVNADNSCPPKAYNLR